MVGRLTEKEEKKEQKKEKKKQLRFDHSNLLSDIPEKWNCSWMRELIN